jgi:GntR family carbon starvation induced transcriptional regulator
MLPSQKFTAAFSAETETPRTLVENAYLALRQDIIEGKHASGTRLRVEHLKDDYGVGAGTLREALSLLVSDALVCSEGQRGFWVSPISPEDLEDITRNRILLETEALRISIRRGDDEWEARLMAAFHRLGKVEEKLNNSALQFREWEKRNRGFHEALIAACDSRWLRYLIGILYRQSERYRRFSLGLNSKRNVHAEHQEIYDAAMQRDEKRACAALESHIGAILAVMREMPGLQVSPAARRRPGAMTPD